MVRHEVREGVIPPQSLLGTTLRQEKLGAQVTLVGPAVKGGEVDQVPRHVELYVLQGPKARLRRAKPPRGVRAHGSREVTTQVPRLR